MDRPAIPSQKELNAFGDVVASSTFGVPAFGIGLLGMQTFMVIYGAAIFFGKPKHERKGRLRYVLISCSILVTSAVAIILDAYDSYRVLRRGGTEGSSYILANQEIWGSFQVTLLVGDAFSWLVVIQGDGLMLWRCFILWRDKKWAVVAPLMTFIGATVCVITSLAWKGDYTAPSRIRPLVAGISLSVATNIMITGLIVSRLVAAWRSQQRAPAHQEGPNVYSNIIIIIIESAAPLAFFGICLVVAAVMGLVYPSADVIKQGKTMVASNVFNWLYGNGFSALSPQMVIFRVTTGSSWKNNQERVTTFSKGIQFASAGSNSKASSSMQLA